MPKYNLNALEPLEFERICQSLVQQIIGPGSKIYGIGRNGAREATFAGKAPYPSLTEQWDGYWIFQAKYHDVTRMGPREARRQILADLDDELSRIVKTYKHPCDNYILLTNVSLTPVFQSGIKDIIDGKIIPKYRDSIKHIHVWGAEEICRFLDNHPNIRKTYAHLLVSGDIIASLLNIVEREKRDLDETVRLYCEGCFSHEKYAVLDDAGDVEDKRIALQRVFIDLNVKPFIVLGEPHITLEMLPPWLRQALDDEERTSVLSYMLDDSILGIVLIGGPGSGKSTLCQHVAQIHRARLLGRLTELRQNGRIEQYDCCIPRIPFRVLLRDYAQWLSTQSSDNLFDFIASLVSHEAAREVSSEDIQEILKSSSVLLILDGLDEVPEKKLRKRVIDNVITFIHQVRNVLKTDLRVIATTRPYGYSEDFDPTRFLHLNTERLTPTQAKNYVHLWTKAREPVPREADRIADTLKVCSQDKIVSVLTHTPLQVTILLVIIRARGTPPKQREELFERYMDIIYRREQKNRPELLRTEQDTIYGLHKYLAYLLHKRAETDRTAALMDLSEFKRRVRDYLAYTNPVLNKEELDDKVNQIIVEARERLVLIESPRAEKIGFSLTTTREFFAAAHLVDTAKDTSERDERFKAIARSPYWRNVALFFAGRVGRTRSGEAPSMIDICRQIDSEDVDKFLRRGAQLVIEMVDDRVLRVPYNEFAAIHYALEILHTGFVKDFDGWVEKLRNLPIEYQERIIRPWLEKKLEEIVPYRLHTFANVFVELFGVDEKLKRALKRAKSHSDARLQVLSAVVKNKIVEFWVVRLLEELVNSLSEEAISHRLSENWGNLRFYLGHPITPRARSVVLRSILEGAESRIHSETRRETIRHVLQIDPEEEPIRNHLYMWATLQLFALLQRSTWYLRRRDFGISLNFPAIVDPRLRGWVKENSSLLERFCSIYSKDTEASTTFLVSLFGFLLRRQYSDLLDIWKQSSSLTNYPLRRFVFPVFGRLPREEGKLRMYHQNLLALLEYYDSEELCKKDLEELNGIVNRKSSIRSHPQRLMIWFEYDCDSSIEKHLDQEVLSELRTWFEGRGLAENLPCLMIMMYRYSRYSRLIDLHLEAIEKIMAEEQTLKVGYQLTRHNWEKASPKQKDRLKSVLEKALKEYQTFSDPGKEQQLQFLYWAALRARIMGEEQMVKLYEIIGDDPNPSIYALPYPRSQVKNVMLNLTQKLMSEDYRVARLAAVTLSALLWFLRGKVKAMPINAVEKLWQLAKDDHWGHRYIRVMARTKLNWVERSEEWLEAIKDAEPGLIQNAWIELIQYAGFRRKKDVRAFRNSLMHILESHDAFSENIRIAALKRLHDLVQEVQPRVSFEEAPLNLPLPKK